MASAEGAEQKVWQTPWLQRAELAAEAGLQRAQGGRQSTEKAKIEVYLAVDVAADGDGGGDGLHGALLHEDLADHVAQPLRREGEREV